MAKRRTRPKSAEPTQLLTQVEFTADDFPRAEAIAKDLGYTQYAYTSTSALWGLFCLRDRPTHRSGCVIKTRELGLLFVQDLDDLQIDFDTLPTEFPEDR